ncbi:SDR family NAD(P)-dependent oxidoreductase [Gordonia hydrophobica]|uniref:SDR family NAD(P)-dependent oxidoreductase n=1 Tax=Gordonia hydrophobica TaxID=40516 RepID=A0ABZ2TZB9_9ACTN|nr:SDR family NAD(P)-dependent oxidoreductase [Gordonia hydrophobica]MBM7368862.1 NAD(P)-dependent dehydrogenase (short-subunit alcohol dehydrogenase family) [Gordonia hydrophobica]
MGVQNLSGRRIIVTGGASGMGEGLVRAFPGYGAEVVSLDLAEEAGRSIADDAGASFQQVDVSDQYSVDRAIAAAVDTLGGLDVLVHAAGIAPFAPSESTPLDLWNTVMAINATGTMLTNQAAFRYLQADGGAILNFASAAGLDGLPGKAAYSASKGAVLAWTRTVAAEWGRYGITVNAIAPAIWTPMYDKTRSEMSEEQLVRHDAIMAQQIPIGGRLGDITNDFVPVMAFYASEGAGFVTGQTIAIDGGTLKVR